MAATRGQLIRKWREDAGMRQEDLATKLGYRGQGVVSHWERGDKGQAALERPALLKMIAAIFGKDWKELEALPVAETLHSDRLGQRIEARLSELTGSNEGLSILRSLGAVEGGVVAEPIHGQAMAPELTAGDVALIDTRTDSPGDGIAWVEVGSQRYFRRVVRKDGKVLLVASNPSYPAIEAEVEDVQVLGRVIWVCRRV